MSTILRWWAVFCSLTASSCIAYTLGFFHFLYVGDLSKISFVTLSLFSLLTIATGVITYKIHGKQDIKYTKWLAPLWFTSEALMFLGIVTTIVGFILMFNVNFEHLDTTNVDNIKKMVGTLSSGLTTSFLGTLVGISTSMLLKLQLVNCEVDLDQQN